MARRKKASEPAETSNTEETQTAGAAATGSGEDHAFGAEVSRLLEILVHSVYANREVFLRELVSNAADACDRLRYEAITHPELTKDDPELGIELVADREAGTLTVRDNGIGMSRAELVDQLGTIARSGTRAFMEAAGETDEAGAAGAADEAGAAGAAGSAKSLIGQFGIGFYSAFMVAGEVQVISARAGHTGAHVWRSDGAGAFTVAPATDADGAPSRGTAVRLSLREGAEEFADPERLKAIVRAHSDHVPFPIDVVEVEGGARGEPERANSASALWTRPRSEIDEDQYREFFGAVSGQFDAPALTIHYKAEGRHEYDVLLFVPSSRPFDLFDPSRKARIKLYVRRVLITDDAEIVPGYLRFVRGVVDSADMPLTVSRDMLQDNPVAASIRKAVTNRVLTQLSREAERAEGAYGTIWEAFGPVIKEGLYEDYERRDDLLELVRFRTTAGDGWRSLKDYIADLKDNQTAIYYLVGEDGERLADSPQLEGFVARGLEVLLLSDPVDSFWTQAVMGYEGKPFKSVTQGAADLSGFPRLDAEGEEAKETLRDAEAATAAAFVKQTLGDQVSDVRLTERLEDSPACLVAPDHGLDLGLERILRERQGGELAAPVLELNGAHDVVRALSAKVASGGGAEAEAAARLLFDYALIADGEMPRDLKGFGRRLQALIEKGLA